ncbi:hypothetical protein [Microbispora bryophytorum]|uniref:hypothetical protein n=1 Tax=Microbispora bryophytorum TaxID=1460882 RepID=UPI0033C59764
MWRDYEEVAVYLLNQIASEFGLEHIEGKRHVHGSRSQTRWEIEGKGIRKGGEGFVIIECRRYTTSRQNQEKMGALAYRIIDTGAVGAIIVSPLGIQEGAQRIAAAEGIETVLMDANSTRTDYMLSFLKKVFRGASDTAMVTEAVSVELIRAGDAQDPGPLAE